MWSAFGNLDGTCCDVDSEKFKLPSKKSCFSVVECGNFLFIIGGKNEDLKNIKVEKSVSRLDVIQNNWLQLAEMTEGRKMHTSQCVKGYILSAFGVDKDDRAMNTGELYNIAKNEWVKLRNPCPHHACAVASTVINDKIYVSGGSTNKISTGMINTVHEFDIGGGIFLLKGHLVKGRCRHSMVADEINQNIYIMGGQTDKNFLNDVEVFSISTMQSSLLKQMIQSRTWISAGFLNGHIYVVGGWGSSRKNARSAGYTDTILCYNIEDEKWSELSEELPVGVIQCCSAVVTVPHN